MMDCRAWLLSAALLPVSLIAETVGVKVYHLAPGDAVTATTWPTSLLQEPRIAESPGLVSVNTAVVLQNTRKTIAVQYCGREKLGKDGTREFIAHFGWVPPSANWYHDGFFSLQINGAHSYHYPFRLVEHAGDAPGTARFTGRMPTAQVHVTFSLRPGDDKLLLDLALEPLPGQGMASVQAIFSCYPSDFAFYEPATRRRAVLTSRRELLNPGPEGSASAADLTAAEPWLLFLDRFYDVAHGRGNGPCALAYDVSRCTVQAACGNYRCLSTATLRPGVTATSFVLWDLSGTRNADAAAYLQSLSIRPTEP